MCDLGEEESLEVTGSYSIQMCLIPNSYICQGTREEIRRPVTHIATGVKAASTPDSEGSPPVFRSGLAQGSLAEEPEVMLVVSLTSTLCRGSSLAGLTGSARDSSMDDESDNPLYIASRSSRGDLTGVVEEMLALRAPKNSPSFLVSG